MIMNKMYKNVYMKLFDSLGFSQRGFFKINTQSGVSNLRARGNEKKGLCCLAFSDMTEVCLLI